MPEDLHSTQAETLHRLIRQGNLPAAVQATAETLLRQLTQPVRLTLLGAPQSGKSTLANLLLAAPVMAPDLRMPTVQIVWGEVAACSCTLSDGSTRRFDHADMTAIAALAPALVTLELPLPALRKISILELASPTTAPEMQRALNWAAGRTDIAIWCTQRFGAAEQAIWASAPEPMRQHAFAVLTKADTLGDGLTGTLTDLRDRAKVDDLFRHVLPVATHAAIAARRADGSIDRDQLTRSGGRALIAAILREVDGGRQAASDRADILLRQYPPQPRVAAEQVAPPPEVAAAPLAEPLTQPPAAEPPLAFIRPATPARSRQMLTAATRLAYEQAIARLVRHGKGWAAAMQETAQPDLARLETDIAQTLHWLSEHLNETGDPRDRHLTRMREAAFDATDLVQLMRLEKSPTTLTESLSLILQLKRDMETCLGQFDADVAAQAMTA